MGYYIPPQTKPENDNQYFEQLSKSVFQAGFNYKVVDQKWPDIVKVFEDFDYKKVAVWDDEKILESLQNPKVIRNAKKIRGIVHNAQIFKEVVEENGTFKNYLKSLRKLSYPEVSKILSKRFKWLGKTGTYVFLWSVNEEVPEWADR